MGHFSSPGQSLQTLTAEQLQAAQRQYSAVMSWIDSLEKRPQSPEVLKFELINGIMYRNVCISDQPRKQLVLPAKYISHVLTSLYDDVGHPGRDRRLTLIRDRFFWAGIQSKDMESWIQQCPRCLRRKTPTNHRAPLVNTVSTGFGVYGLLDLGDVEGRISARVSHH